jgi:hypothetical protein
MSDALTSRAAHEYRNERDRQERTKAGSRLAVLHSAPSPACEEDYDGAQAPPAPIDDAGPRHKGNGADGPQRDYVPPGSPGAALFKFERWGEIAFNVDEEYLIDGILPKQGVGLLYGASQTFKSFIATHMGLHVARAQPWAGRQTEGAPVVYLAAEGAPGLRKRKAGYVNTGRVPADGVDFALVSAAPNLGTADGDFDRLVATIKSAAIKPGLIIVDTIAKVIGGADENGAGMAQFLLNVQALAQIFDCFVLAIHHTGWNEDAKDRPRGWSGLPAALDVMILSERKPGDMHATATIQKSKDELSGFRLTAHLERIVLGISRTGREVSTLIVEVVETEAPAVSNPTKSIPRSRRLIMDMVLAAIEEAGEDIRPFANGPIIRAVSDETVRRRYYARIAEQAAPDEDVRKMAERQRKGFNRAISDVLNAKDLMAQERDGRGSYGCHARDIFRILDQAISVGPTGTTGTCL